MKDDEYKGYYCLLIAIFVRLECNGSQKNVQIWTRPSTLSENPEKEDSETVCCTAEGI